MSRMALPKSSKSSSSAAAAAKPGLLSTPGPNMAQPTTFPQYTSGPWANLPTGTWGAPAQPPPQALTTPPPGGMAPPPGFNVPAGFNVVAIGPSGIPTLGPIAPAKPQKQKKTLGSLFGGSFDALPGPYRRASGGY